MHFGDDRLRIPLLVVCFARTVANGFWRAPTSACPLHLWVATFRSSLCNIQPDVRSRLLYAYGDEDCCLSLRKATFVQVVGYGFPAHAPLIVFDFAHSSFVVRAFLPLPLQ
jgi:hypothetical protein